MDLKDFQKNVNEINDKYGKDETGNGHIFELDLSDMEWVCSCGAMKFSGERRNSKCRNAK